MKTKHIATDDNWITPDYIYKALDDEFNFNFDPCPYNPEPYFDALKTEWGTRVFLNPPYNRHCKPKFVIKGIEHALNGNLVVMLLPVSTSTDLFHLHILPSISEPVRFCRKRIKFQKINDRGEIYTPKAGPAHDSMICIFDGIK